ncbi:unnamed protein product [Citrullus colocynthis]|uniref:DC1 domain-containing protein n=1 Tax=Citrullus colocynthis TaxID=252529 RepID=A0ABP0XSI1_9ROSI
MSSDTAAAVDDGRNMTNRLQLQAAHPLHHHENHPLAFINSLHTLHRHFMISLQDFSDPSITGILFRSTGFFHCAACSTATPGGPSFHCLACPFSLSAACAALPLITVDNHPHPLLLLNRNSDHKHLICAVCDEGISFPSFVRCVHCDAFLHLQCALPPVIKAHNHHLHQIVLSSSEIVAANNNYDNLCSVCGEERDGVSWVYCCEICPFLAHVGCVIYDHQIPSEKEAEEGSITTQLCTLALDNDEHNLDEEGSHESILKPGVTLQQILDSFSESDDAEYQTLITAMMKAAGGDSDDDDEPENGTNSEDKHLYHFWNLEKPLYDLIEKLELEDVDPFEGFDRNSPTVLVGNRYLVVEKLARTFTRVFMKHGDISERSNMGMKVKTIVWNLFCNVIDDMSRMELEKMTGEDLVSWMIGIRTIELAGFDVEFAFEGWKKIAMAFFGVRAKEVAEELVEEMEEKIKQQRLKLEKLCEEQLKLLSLREKCVMEALAMDSKFVGDGLI